ncbi:MAG: trimethylamine methyltransferase family protein [Planctomycetota bacterium]|jgi:trimethylamine--corrinoid protein Co-methyltransferase
MAVFEMDFKPKLSFLSAEDKTRIQRGIVEVLSVIGMEIMHEEARALLQNAGGQVPQDGMVRIPDKLVEKAVKSAPENIAIYDREENHVMDLGGHRSYFGTGSDLIYSLDSEKLTRQQCVLDDVAQSARVSDALPNIDFIMSFAHPSDMPPERAYLLSFQAMANNSTKPIVCTAECRDDLHEMWQIAKIIRGGEENLRAKPYFIHYAEPISPLKHPVDSLDKLLFCAEKGIPVIYSPAPIAGSTAPITLAGHVVQGLAECFCGLVIHQLKAEGSPFLMGMGPAVLDMVTGQCSYNAPEYLMAYMAIVEMSHYYNLPNWGYAGTSDSQIPDEQASFEAGLITFMAAMVGSNLNHDVGYLDFGRTGSLEMIVMLNEIIDQVRRMQRGIPVDDDQIAVPVIRDAGPQGQFITHDHTVEHLRATQWRPKLFSRMGFETWEETGSQSLLQRAQQRLAEILDNHRAPSIPQEKQREIQVRVDGFKV